MDLQEWKLDLATKCGADLVFNPSQCQVQDEIDKLTDGYGCDVYFEATGHPASVPQGIFHSIQKKIRKINSNFYLGLDLLTRLGRFVCFSVFLKDVTADWSLIGKAFLFMGSSENQLSLKLDSMPDFQNCRKKMENEQNILEYKFKFQEIQELKNHKIKNG